MLEQTLVPGMQDGQDAQAGFPTGTGELQQGGGRGLKEEADHDSQVGPDQGMELVGKGEDHMEIANRQQFDPAFFEPAGLGQGPAFGTMPVAAGVVGGLFVAAMGAALEVSAQGRGPAHEQGPHDPSEQGRRLELVHESRAVTAQHVGDFPTRALRRAALRDAAVPLVHRCAQLLLEADLGKSEQVQDAARSGELRTNDPDVTRRGAQRAVPHQYLDGAQVHPFLQ